MSALLFPSALTIGVLAVAAIAGGLWLLGSMGNGRDEG